MVLIKMPNSFNPDQARVWSVSSRFSTRSAQIQPVQSKKARSLKFRILEEEGLYYLSSKSKALISCATVSYWYLA